jgi:hypothetical protein
MSFESQSANLEDFTLQETQEPRTVSCPRCGSNVPESIYCLACGCPLEIDENIGREETEFDVEELRKIQGGGTPSTELNVKPNTVIAGTVEEGFEFVLNPDKDEDPRTQETEEVSIESASQTLEEIMLRTIPQTDDENQLEIPESLEEVPKGSWDYEMASDTRNGIEPSVKELAKDLLNSAYMELWSVGLLEKRGAEEDQFIKVFEVYRERFEKSTEHRQHLLNQVQDMKAAERKANEAWMSLEELDVRKALGDLHSGEYKAMAPAFQWMIKHHEGEVERRRERVAVLQSFTGLISPERLEEIGIMVEDAQRIIDSVEGSVLSRETSSDVRRSIENISQLLESFSET